MTQLLDQIVELLPGLAFAGLIAAQFLAVIAVRNAASMEDPAHDADPRRHDHRARVIMEGGG